MTREEFFNEALEVMECVHGDMYSALYRHGDDSYTFSVSPGSGSEPMCALSFSRDARKDMNHIRRLVGLEPKQEGD